MGRMAIELRNDVNLGNPAGLRLMADYACLCEVQLNL